MRLNPPLRLFVHKGRLLYECNQAATIGDPATPPSVVTRQLYRPPRPELHRDANSSTSQTPARGYTTSQTPWRSFTATRAGLRASTADDSSIFSFILSILLVPLFLVQ
ncbi:unnamed protein product [Linum trigynum]|uniref:Uncharacterized protein n=1 Tax=Linum trigynum TaxID=586398 RepID=A0AAV2CCV0_9ROSI